MLIMLENKNVKLVSIEEIIPNRFQPRQIFAEKELNELADSIKQHGIIQPLILRPLGDKYEIIAGERRYKAALIAGLYNVPAIIVEKSDDDAAEIAIIENVQRENLTPIEEAKSYQKLLDKGFTQEEIARRLGIAQSTLANKLRLLNLPQEIQDALLNNKISERHARGLLRLQTPEDQINLMNKIINERINVKDTDEEIDKILGIKRNEIEEPAITEKKPIENIQPISNNIEMVGIEENKDIENEEILRIDEDQPENFDEIEGFDENDISEDEYIENSDIPEIIELGYPEKKYKYLDTVDETRSFIENLKNKGIKIDVEEYDLENEYSIIIKIEK